MLGALVWGALIFWASSQPNPFPQLPRGLFDHDKLLHAAAYAVLGALVLAALGGVPLRPWVALSLTIAVGTAYGASDEWHQSFVPNRCVRSGGPRRRRSGRRGGRGGGGPHLATPEGAG